MIIVLKRGTDRKTIDQFSGALKRTYNVDVNEWQGVNETVLGLIGDTTTVDIGTIKAQDIVYSVKRVQEPYKKANRKFHPEDTVITLSNGAKIGGGNLTLIAGPCSVESESLLKVRLQKLQRLSRSPVHLCLEVVLLSQELHLTPSKD